MDISKPLPSDLSQSRIICKFKNLNSIQLENLVFQAAVPKYLKLEMLPPSSTTIHPANSLSAEVTQEIRLTNSMQGQKSIMLKLKIGYKQGQLTVRSHSTYLRYRSVLRKLTTYCKCCDLLQVDEMAQVSSFPPLF